MAEKKKKTAENELAEIVDSITAEVGETDVAIELVQARLQKDRGLAQRLHDYLERLALRTFINSRHHRRNDSINKSETVSNYSPNPSPLSDARGARATAHLHRAENVYSYKVGGRYLGDLRGEELIPVAEQLERTADGMRDTANTLRELSKRIPAKETVRSSISAKELDALWEKYRKDGSKKAASAEPAVIASGKVSKAPVAALVAASKNSQRARPKATV